MSVLMIRRSWRRTQRDEEEALGRYRRVRDEIRAFVETPARALIEKEGRNDGTE